LKIGISSEVLLILQNKNYFTKRN